jgi:hypothetical protein
MDFIIKRSKIFKKMVLNDFVKSYNLKSADTIRSLENSYYYSKHNYIIIHNSILNDRYNMYLDDNMFSIVFVLYKNIKYSQKDDKKIALLDSCSKKNIRKIMSKYTELPFISKDMGIIGRKYISSKNQNDIKTNCFDILCTLKPSKDFEFEFNVSSDVSTLKLINSIPRSILRRRFLQNIQESSGLDWKTKDILNNSIFIDAEFVNDIYDDFSKFPNSYDTSMLFMIGLSYIDKDIDKDIIGYKNFTTDKLSRIYERILLTDFLIFLERIKSKTQSTHYILFHWSNADKYILERALKRYPDLYEKYETIFNNIIYVDLLKIVKKILPGLQSYSLKYISKYLLNTIYNTNCQNGLEAMCSIIEKNVYLNSDNSQEQNTLLSFDTTTDIINYNRLDTILLYDIVKYCLNISR